jgi:hypothetical protein
MFLLAQLLQRFPYYLIAHKTEIEVSGQRATCRLPDLMLHTEESRAAIAGGKALHDYQRDVATCIGD